MSVSYYTSSVHVHVHTCEVLIKVNSQYDIVSYIALRRVCNVPKYRFFGNQMHEWNMRIESDSFLASHCIAVSFDMKAMQCNTWCSVLL